MAFWSQTTDLTAPSVSDECEIVAAPQETPAQGGETRDCAPFTHAYSNASWQRGRRTASGEAPEELAVVPLHHVKEWKLLGRVSGVVRDEVGGTGRTA